MALRRSVTRTTRSPYRKPVARVTIKVRIERKLIVTTTRRRLPR